MYNIFYIDENLQVLRIQAVTEIDKNEFINELNNQSGFQCYFPSEEEAIEFKNYMVINQKAAFDFIFKAYATKYEIN